MSVNRSPQQQLVRSSLCRPAAAPAGRVPFSTRRAFLRAGLAGALVSLTGCAGAGGVVRYARGLIDGDEPAAEGVAPVDSAVVRRQEAVDQVIVEARAEMAARVADVWGDEATPSAKVWIWYDKPMTTRCFLDFERGEVLAETIVEPGEDSAAALERLRDMVWKAAHDGPSDMAKRDFTMRTAAKKAEDRGTRVPWPPPPPPDEKPVLAGVIPEDADEAVTAERVEATPFVGKDGKQRTKLSYRVPFSEGAYSKLAARHADVVLAAADTHGLPPSLILAVIQTESAFNPRATSHVPAYGLMQIVPRSAGLDATAFLYGRARLLDPEFLYEPGNNVTLGAAYLRLLDSRYLRAIEHPRSRLYGAIAAYNTGAGNVARAFTGTTSMRAAASVVNNMPPDRVFAHLRERLPFEETRRYIDKVTRAQANYRAWDEVLVARA
jgi:membrane-bound lytic murein transglycosylase C